MPARCCYKSERQVDVTGPLLIHSHGMIPIMKTSGLRASCPCLNSAFKTALRRNDGPWQHLRGILARRSSFQCSVSHKLTIGERHRRAIWNKKPRIGSRRPRYNTPRIAPKGPSHEGYKQLQISIVILGSDAMKSTYSTILI